MKKEVVLRNFHIILLSPFLNQLNTYRSLHKNNSINYISLQISHVITWASDMTCTISGDIYQFQTGQSINCPFKASIDSLIPMSKQ